MLLEARLPWGRRAAIRSFLLDAVSPSRYDNGMNGSLLDENNLKKTRKRQAILGILAASKTRLTADDIFAACRKSLSLNLSTVYRTLSTLAEKGLVTKAVEPDGKSYYSLACGSIAKNHHHHLVCAKCKAIIELDECPLEELNEKISSETGFVITGHSMELTGLCPKCQ